MADPISQRVASLSQLSTERLRELWRQTLERSPSPGLRKNLMVPILAFRIQEQAFGGLRPELHRRLSELVSAGGQIGSALTLIAKPGTRLVRQWRGQTHVVTVAEDGCEYRGARFESLSEIARRITGTRWSGPLFFGLRDKQGSKGKRGG
jgi:hypothetical protein